MAQEQEKRGLAGAAAETDLTAAALRQQQNEQGYADGYAGRPLNVELAKASDAYADGWDAGNSDRPSLAEVMPLDVGKEQTSWWL